MKTARTVPSSNICASNQERMIFNNAISNIYNISRKKDSRSHVALFRCVYIMSPWWIDSMQLPRSFILFHWHYCNWIWVKWNDGNKSRQAWNVGLVLLMGQWVDGRIRHHPAGRHGYLNRPCRFYWVSTEAINRFRCRYWYPTGCHYMQLHIKPKF